MLLATEAAGNTGRTSPASAIETCQSHVSLCSRTIPAAGLMSQCHSVVTWWTLMCRLDDECQVNPHHKEKPCGQQGQELCMKGQRAAHSDHVSLELHLLGTPGGLVPSGTHVLAMASILCGSERRRRRCTSCVARSWLNTGDVRSSLAGPTNTAVVVFGLFRIYTVPWLRFRNKLRIQQSAAQLRWVRNRRKHTPCGLKMPCAMG